MIVWNIIQINLSASIKYSDSFYYLCLHIQSFIQNNIDINLQSNILNVDRKTL